MSDVRIVKLDPMRVAYAHGFGASPEEEAWDKLLTWARQEKLALDRHRFFGHDNPSPSPGSPNYGYDQWMTIGAEVEVTGDVKVKEFVGGLYAVMRCKLPEIGPAWKNLVAWCEDSQYQFGHAQCLEESISPPDTPFDEVVMDLYLSIIK